MRGATSAVDHVWLEEGQVRYHVVGDAAPEGLCSSGLLDLVAVLLELEIIDESGYLEGKEYRLEGTDVTLTQKDVREVQLAKAAIRAGIELLAEKLGVEIGDIQRVYLAGAFGNYLDPASACRIGMIPPALLENPSEALPEYYRWVVDGLTIATAHRTDPEKQQILEELKALSQQEELRWLTET